MPTPGIPFKHMGAVFEWKPRGHRPRLPQLTWRLPPRLFTSADGGIEADHIRLPRREGGGASP